VRHLACLVVVPLLILAGCGPSLSVQRLTTDASGQEPVLQVWCRDAKRLDGHDVQVLVGWNRWLGTASVDATTVRPDGLLVVNVAKWQPNQSDFDKFNEMRVEFSADGRLFAKRQLPAPTDFANAFDAAHPKPGAAKPPEKPSVEQPADAPK